MQFPLTYAGVVEEIVAFTSLTRAEAEYRVWMQLVEPGWNVLQDVARFEVTPHRYDENMAQLYREGEGFIFETLVFWSKPGRFRWTQLTLDRIRAYMCRTERSPSDVDVLILGDGTGSDSLYLADHGFHVHYFDVPGSKTFDFAMKRFAHYGFLGRSITPICDYNRCLAQEYDVVICYEVLEHLPDPLQAIQDIGRITKVGGIALITEDFSDVIARLLTHLKMNARYFGKTPFLFLKHGMLLNWYSRDELFRPSEYVKHKRVSYADMLGLLKDYNVRSTFLAGYLSPLSRSIEKLAYVGR